MAYIAGNGAGTHRKVVLVGRDGKSQVSTPDEGAYEDLDLSPDGRRIALTIQGPNWHIWIYDIPRGTLTRLTFDNDNRDPHWSADGKRVAYPSIRSIRPHRRASFLAPPRIWRRNKMARHSLPSRPMDYPATANLSPLPPGSFNEWGPQFSQDGHWMSYGSDESGRGEISGPGGKWQISTAGGGRAVWSHEGRELFYRSGGKQMAVPVDTARFYARQTASALGRNYFATGHYFDVMPGAKQFVYQGNRAGARRD